MTLANKENDCMAVNERWKSAKSNKHPNRIKELREAAGISQRKLAELSDSSYSTIQKWEYNKCQPNDIYLMKRIANILGVEHADDLIDWDTVIEEDE